jgi:type IV pilus assembly protein PilM
MSQVGVAQALSKRKKVDVLIVAIHKETLETYRQLVANVGLNVCFFEIEIFSTARSVLDKGIAPVMIFDMGASTTKLYLVEHGVVRSSHIINRGSREITATLAKSLGITTRKAEELKRAKSLEQGSGGKNIAEIIPIQLDYIFSEARRVVLQYEKKYNKVVSKIVLTGGGVMLPGLLEMARERFEIEVVYGNPFAKLETPAFLDEMLVEAGPEFAVAIGVALRQLQSSG